MSNNLPIDPSGPPEFLGEGAPERSRMSRTKLGVLAGVGVVAAGAVGVGAWGVAQLMGGGPGAAAILPDTVLAYVAVDLDPSAGQKIEAIKTLQKFPAIKRELGINADDDVRRWVVDKLRENGECGNLDYADDIEPWIGDKAAVAALPNNEHIADPVFAVQVTDQAKAEDGIATLFSECDEPGSYGLAFYEGYAIVAETEEIANATVEATKAGSLADSSDYQDSIDDLGDIGVLTLYVAPGGPQALMDGVLGTMPLEGSDDTGEEQLSEALKNFTGAAGTLRFEGGGIELAVAARGIDVGLDGGAVTSIGDLPESTVVALGLGLPEGWVETVEGQLADSMGEDLYNDMLAQAERETGLDLPEDLERMLGSGLVVALDGTTDFEAFLSQFDPSTVKAGFRIDQPEGDVSEIIAALLRASGAPQEFGEVVRIRESGDRVALGFDDAYLDTLLEGGDLGDGEKFGSAVAEADKALAALFVDFDAQDGWLERLAGDITDNDPEVVDNLAPLDALGVSGWLDEDVSHMILRLSTD